MGPQIIIFLHWLINKQKLKREKDLQEIKAKEPGGSEQNARVVFLPCSVATPVARHGLLPSDQLAPEALRAWIRPGRHPLPSPLASPLSRALSPSLSVRDTETLGRAAVRHCRRLRPSQANRRYQKLRLDLVYISVESRFSGRPPSSGISGIPRALHRASPANTSPSRFHQPRRPSHSVRGECAHHLDPFPCSIAR